MLIRLTLLGLILSCSSITNGIAAETVSEPDSQPNILWITSEDNGCFLGCYGDPSANTPNLDALAARGIRFDNCYANAPVCAVVRSSWIMGVPAVTTGTQHMRSKYRMPPSLTPYPKLLREAGYYVTNHTKTDYNTRSFGTEIWNDGSQKAHFKNAPADKPFFAVVNIKTSHESQIFPKNWPDGREPKTPADKIQIPPYQVSTAEVITDWRRMHDQNSIMDARVGEVLKELDETGRADNTIVIYCADHGGITLRSKRYLYDSGTHVPLIAAFPSALQHLAHAKPGSTSERLVQFIDMPPTWLSLAGVDVPSAMPGRIFLGDQQQSPPETVFLFSDRFDEAPDMRRGVTDGRWKYIRNFQPDRPRFQMLDYPRNQLGQQSQRREYVDGKTDGFQSAFYEAQPSEELYDTASDPHEINNLAVDPAHSEQLKTMRSQLKQHILVARDCGFIPEPLLAEIDADSSTSIYDFGMSTEKYPLERVLDVAMLASDRDAGNIAELVKLAKDPQPIVRYWAITGLRMLGKQAQPATDALNAALKLALNDSESSVRITAATALGNLGQQQKAITLLIAEAKAATNDPTANWALDGIKFLDAPNALGGVTEQGFVKGPYSKRTFELLKAGGSMRRSPTD